MAIRKHNSSRKPRNSVSSASKRSSWAACMNGADPEWLSGHQARALAEVFGGVFPAWLIESEPWRQINGARFRFLRQTMLGLSTEQCAAYLDVHRSTICRWEADEIDTPKAAFEALRLISRTANSVTSDKRWDGWYVLRGTGELVSPDVGRLAVTPEEINAIPSRNRELSELRNRVDQCLARIGDLEAENTALRSDNLARQMAAELETMRERIGALLASVRTAEIIEFNQPGAEQYRAA